MLVTGFRPLPNLAVVIFGILPNWERPQNLKRLLA